MSVLNCNLYLPDDLLPQILSKLPVKSLLRFRCISNSWLTLIEDPKFARLHLSRDNGESQLFAQLEGGFSSHPGIEYQLWCSKRLKTTFYSCLYGFGTYRVVAVFDGLFILSDMIRREVILWNPSIRKSRLIPKSPEIHKGMIEFVFGFGFSPAINDYKYVTSVHSGENGLKFFAVYTLGSNSWKMIEFQSQSSVAFDFITSPDTNPVCISGVLYAINEDSYLDVVSFDLDSERFGCFSLPDHNTRLVHELLYLGDRGGSLALVQVSQVNGQIWIRQTTSWAKCLSFTFTCPPGHNPDPMFLDLNTNGDLLLQWKRLWDWKTAITSVNIETKEEKIRPLPKNYVIGVWRYTESLFLLS